MPRKYIFTGGAYKNVFLTRRNGDKKYTKKSKKRTGKKLTENQMWKLIEDLNWKKNKNQKDYKSKANKKLVNKLTKSEFMQLKNFVLKKWKLLDRKYQGDWLGTPGIPVGDDSWMDLRAEVVGRGKDFYNNITPEKMRTMAKNGDYTESFIYIFNDYVKPVKVTKKKKKTTKKRKRSTKKKKTTKKRKTKKKSSCVAKFRKTAKYERCVKKVKAQNKKNNTNYNPWAICTNSMKKTHC